MKVITRHHITALISVLIMYVVPTSKVKTHLHSHEFLREKYRTYMSINTSKIMWVNWFKKKTISKTASNDDVWSLSDIFFSNKIQETILFLTIWTFSNQWEEDVCSTYRNLFSAWVWKVLTTRFLVMRYIGAPAKTTHTSGAGRRSLSLSYLEKIRKKAV